jgi:hypothetical protein
MATNVGESQAVFDLIRYHLFGSDAVTFQRAKGAAQLLAASAHKALGAGPTSVEVGEWFDQADPVLIMETWGTLWGGVHDEDDVNRPPTYTEVLEDVVQSWIGGRPVYEAALNAQGREVLG